MRGACGVAARQLVEAIERLPAHLVELVFVRRDCELAWRLDDEVRHPVHHSFAVFVHETSVVNGEVLRSRQMAQVHAALLLHFATSRQPRTEAFAAEVAPQRPEGLAVAQSDEH